MLRQSLENDFSHPVLEEYGGKFSIKKLYKAVKGDFRKDYPPKVAEFLEKNGSKIIQKVTVLRTPVSKTLETAINLISLGKWNKAKKKYGFDTFFHLAMEVQFDDNTNVVVEKNATIGIRDASEKSQQADSNAVTERLELPVRNRFSFNHMLNGAKRILGDERFFRYDAFTSNCQLFVKSMLEAIGMYTDNAKAFVYQNIEDLIEDLPFFVGSVAKKITDIQSYSDIAGSGLKNFRGKQNYFVDKNGINTNLHHKHRRKSNQHLN